MCLLKKLIINILHFFYFQYEVSSDKIITSFPDCSFPFHWPNYAAEPLLCIRNAGIPFCHWSNGIPINEIKNIYINIRNDLGDMYFLRLEVEEVGATFNFVFNDAYSLPPPYRFDNYSQVIIYISQLGCKPQFRSVVKPQSSLAYVLDDPIGLQTLQIEAPGGNAIKFSLHNMENSESITYANFIYIFFKKTCDSSHLVLSVKDRKVIIAKKCAGDRSQLWLMNSSGQLEHEGSSPPIDNNKGNEKNRTRMVLDLEKPVNPTDYTKLVLRPPNKQRITTQTWRFENGRLLCHANMCVQVSENYIVP